MSDYRLADYQMRSAPLLRVPMGASAPQGMALSELLNLAGTSLDELFADMPLSYAASQGDADLRALISQDYPGLQADNIVLFAGANEAIFSVNQVLLQAGDKVQGITPAYEPLLLGARRAGALLDTVSMAFIDGQWQLDVAHWLEKISPLTRMAVINFPHNPTGCLLSRMQLNMMVEHCRNMDVWLFSDEVFRGLEYQAADQLPAVASVYEKGISLGVMSKALGFGGIRIGWVACQDQQLIQRLLAFKQWLSVCHGQADARLALLAMQHKSQIIDSNRQLISENLQTLQQAQVYNQFFQARLPTAGCVMFPQLHDMGEVDPFVNDLLEQTGVMLIPGQCFLQGQQHVRLGFGRKDFPRALAGLEHYLACAAE